MTSRRRIAIDRERPEPRILDEAAAVLRNGGLVAFPTETVYGLGAHALDERAVRGVFTAKGRPAHNPLIVHVADTGLARDLASEWPDLAERLAAAFWPGPLTLVLPRAPMVPDLVTAGLPDVALRVPAHPVALALLQVAGIPLVAPSANPSSRVSPTRAEHVERWLGDRVDLILDAGPTGLGIESTVVGLSGPEPLLLRPGALPAHEIELITGPLRTPEAGPDTPRHASPGLLERHYAPRARLVLCQHSRLEKLEGEAEEAARRGQIVAALTFSPIRVRIHRAVTMPGEPDEYARRLYADLHDMDDAGCDLILVEDVPEGREWDGVRDRIRRAAAD
jgi:L-threonylcarbamoyladenylate synthase